MKRVSLVFGLTMGIATLASAQATRTWVSGVGNDANPCSRTAPCKTFAGAMSKTASPGIINCLDPGGYGAVTINKSITIDCTATLGSVLASGVQGVIVNGAAADKIVLRNIDINGAGTTLGTNGVNFIAGGSLAIYDVHIASFSSNGVTVSSTTGAHKLLMKSCQVLNNFRGVNLAPTAPGTVDADIDFSNFENNTPGFGVDVVSSNCTATVHNSTFTHNAGGLQVQNGTGSASLNNCMLTHNTTGVFGGAEVRLNNCSITNNGTGVSGTTRGFQSNMIIGNTAGNTVTTSVIGQ
jgi:hypothetical protein